MSNDWTIIDLPTHPAGAQCRVSIDSGWYDSDSGEPVFVKSSRKVSGTILGARRSNYTGHVVVMAAANIARGHVRTFRNCDPSCVAVR